MKKKYFLYGIVSFIINLSSLNVFAQALKGYSFKIVNMQPNSQSNEIFFDSETNIAVDPSNPTVIAGSAFTPNPTGSLTTGPIYISTDGGNTWSLNNILPSGNGFTSDISLGFGATSGTLYSGLLKGGSSFRNMMLRTATPSAATTMTTLLDRSTVSVDQPFISATTVNDASFIPRDRIFAGDNDLSEPAGTGKSAEVVVSNDAGSAPPSGLTIDGIESRTTNGQDFPAIRTAIHSSGVVYAVFYRWTSGSSSPFSCDVVVTRDDNFATGSTPFGALVDGGDTKAGLRVATSVSVPAAFFSAPVSLGNNRLVASNLAIAVDPGNSANVIIAWCDRVSTTDYTIHFKRSSTSGKTWDGSDWLTITNATNPGIAIGNGGKVGLIYQQLVGSGSTAKWETHFRLAAFSGTTFSDDILSTFLDSDLGASTISPSLGDYLRIQAVGSNFYGVFPASNRPVTANFPHSVTYLRNADFTTGNLRDITNTSTVAVSVDPFFFRISPFLISICVLYPQACKVKYLIPNNILHISPYPCLRCPWPCLQCPPFEIPVGDIYEQVYANKAPQTVLTAPYFHLSLDGLNAKDFNVSIVTSDGEPIAQQMNKTDKGYMISFRVSENNFNTKDGIHGLKMLVTPKNATAAKKGADFKYRFQASDYRFKEFTTMNK